MIFMTQILAKECIHILYDEIAIFLKGEMSGIQNVEFQASESLR